MERRNERFSRTPGFGRARGPGRPRKFDDGTALEAALELFWRQGYAATSLSELTAAMGVSRSSLYASFGNKRDVLLKAIDLYVERRLGELVEIAAESVDPVAAVRRMLARLAEPDGGEKGCFLVNCITELAPDDPDVVDAARRTTMRVEMLLMDALAAASTSAAGRGRHRATARALMSAAFGATLMRKSGRSRRDVREMLASVEPLIGG